MRILTLTNLFPNPLQPGRAPFNRQQLRALAKVHAVQVIAPVAWTDELMGFVRHGKRLQPDRHAVCDGISVVHPRYLYPPKLLRGRYGHMYRWCVRPAFQQAVDQFRPDLIFAPWAYPDGWAAVELGHAAGLPVVVKVHGSDVLTLDSHPARRRRTAEALCRADGVIAVSGDLARHIVDLGAEPERVRVIYNGVNTQAFHPGSAVEARARLGLDPRRPLLLFVGRLVPVKGLEVLLDACARLVRDGSEWTCCLIGEGPCRAALERQIDRLGLRDCVRLAGSVPHNELPDWYRAAGLFVLPSRSEGVPNALLEAAACDLPFVASRVGGVPEIAHLVPNRLTPAGDANALAAAISTALAGDFQAAGPGIARVRTVEEAAAELSVFLEKTCAGYSPYPLEAQ